MAEIDRSPSDDKHLLGYRDGEPIGSFTPGFNRVLKEPEVLFS